MISYSLKSRKAVARLMRPYNDIDVYVEDHIYRGIYKTIFEKVLDGRARITKVIALGPKETVIAAAASDMGEDNRPKIYIVDGDFDLITKFRRKKIRRLHRLQVYSVENLVLEKSSLANYFTLVFPGVEKDKIDSMVSLDEFFHVVDMVGRHYIFALAVAYRLGIRHTDLRVSIRDVFLCEGGRRALLDRRYLRDKTFKIIRLILNKSGRSSYRDAKEKIKVIIQRRNLSAQEYCPGKEILWYLNEIVGHRGGEVLKQKIIVSYLAQHCSLNLDKALEQNPITLDRSLLRRTC